MNPAARMEERHFDEIRMLLYNVARIDIKPGKQSLVEHRISSRIRSLGLNDFDEYVDLLLQDGSKKELARMVDALTTNKTNFFREPKHYDLLIELLPELTAQGDLRIWSAGCSSGEEPYTMSMLLHEKLPPATVKRVQILATDISDSVLASARAGVYSLSQVDDVPEKFRRKYFAPADKAPNLSAVRPQVRSIVRFAWLNLMGAWPMKGPFDVIFCRNVMIYFDRPTVQDLVKRFHDLLRPGGYFFISHSESMTGIEHPYAYVQPGVYRRAGEGT